MLNNIITPGIERILRFFYENKNQCIHLRELARKTELNENSAYRFLNKLELSRILSSEKEGNMKRYKIKKTKETYALFTCFDTEKMQQLNTLRKDAINIFIDTLDEKPIIMFLFGSTAKNNYTKESDIDILLISNKKIDTTNAKNYVETQTSMKINDFQITLPKFKKEIKIKEEPVIQSAIETGYPLTNHIYYYTCIYDEYLRIK
ncbi:MAG: nucleotidyltransferase domain-containing protein [DPANN group archaeon]|nr:nucleotidyltransferase domain-containing protein [DPANN group archaeon]